MFQWPKDLVPNKYNEQTVQKNLFSRALECLRELRNYNRKSFLRPPPKKVKSQYLKLIFFTTNLHFGAKYLHEKK